MQLSHADIVRRAGELSAGEELAEALKQRILRSGMAVGARVEHHSTLGSCMARLEDLAGEAEAGGSSLECGTVVIAERLEHASGRFQREWHAPHGGLWLAMAFSDILLPQFTALLPMAVGIACCEAVRLHGVPAKLKWVNDVHVRGKKIAGILCRSMTSPEGERIHLLGMGINVNNRAFPPELESIAISASEVLGREVSLVRLCLDLLARLVWNIGLLQVEEAGFLEQDGDASTDAVPENSLLGRWEQLSDTIGRGVLFGQDVQLAPQYTARVLGIDRWGGLKLLLADGATITEYAGELRYL